MCGTFLNVVDHRLAIPAKEREMSALFDERSRQEFELRQRRLRRRPISPSDEVVADAEGSHGNANACPRDDTIAVKSEGVFSMDKKVDDVQCNRSMGAGTDSSSRVMLEAAARASLRTKFDHVGIDQLSSSDRDARAIAINRGMTNSPPPPSLTMSGGVYPATRFLVSYASMYLIKA